MGKFTGKIAIVTGGALGIGGATARNFAKNGATVVIADIDEDAANDNVKKINSLGKWLLLKNILDFLKLNYTYISTKIKILYERIF